MGIPRQGENYRFLPFPFESHRPRSLISVQLKLSEINKAERVRFELTVLIRHDSFQDCCLKPLGHLSALLTLE